MTHQPGVYVPYRALFLVCHARNVNQWLGETLPFHWLTYPQHETLVYVWSPVTHLPV